MAQAPLLSGQEKLEAVTVLVKHLNKDLQDGAMSPTQRDADLQMLKLYGRDPTDADPIFTPEGIETLGEHAFRTAPSATSRHALRCLANALLLKPDTRQLFVDRGYGVCACDKLQSDCWDDEFLLSRILFLTTYDTKVDWPALIVKHHLAERIVENLKRHIHQGSSTPDKAGTDAMEDMALVETAKLLFNVTHFSPDHGSSFASAIPPVVSLLRKHKFSASSPLDPPLGQLVNALLNLPVDDKGIQSTLFPESEPNAVVDRLVELFDYSTESYEDNELEQFVTPLVGVLRGLYGLAPESVQRHIQAKLLPSEEDRKGVLGRGESLSSRILRNSTNPMTPHFREAISHFLFEMSDKDADKFVRNVGYGFASGFLFQNNLPIPASASGTANSEGGGSPSRQVNPVTGQFLDLERHADVPEMTHEEKEREAERLFVLFERLRTNGLISAQNPVAQALQEGRFEELDDDEAEGVD